MKTFVEVLAIEARSKLASRIETAVYFATDPKPGQVSVSGKDEAIPGNSNAGHEYGARAETLSDGTPGKRALTPDERLDLLEYLKSL